MHRIFKTTLTLAVLVLALTSSVHAVWETSSYTNYPADSLSKTNGSAPGSAQTLSTMSVPASPSQPPAASTQTIPDSPVDVTPEIAALARALEYNPRKCYEYCRNNIAWTPTYRGVNGATGCLQAKRGNEWDTGLLLGALLKASGYSVRYKEGRIGYEKEDLSAWYGVNTNKLNYIIHHAGDAVWDVTGEPTWYATYRFWVEASISNTWYVFDPAFKEYRDVEGCDLGAAMGFSETTFLADAMQGAQTNINYVEDANRDEVHTNLMEYSTSLLSYIETNAPNASLKQITGGREIVPEILTNYTTQLPKAQHVWDTHIRTESDLSGGYFHAKLTVQHNGINKTLVGYEMAGNRVTIVYDSADSYKPKLYVGGELVATGNSTTPGGSYTLALIVSHPFLGKSIPDLNYDRTYTFDLISGSTYLIAHDFGGSSPETVAQQNMLLSKYISEGLSESSEAMLGQGMHASMESGFLQWQGCVDIMSDLADAVGYAHHFIGVMGINSSGGYYVDLPGFASVSCGRGAEVLGLEWIHSYSLTASGLEHGLLQQVQGKEKVAASTVKLADINNEDSNKIFLTDSSNWNTGYNVKSKLDNYTTAEKNVIQGLVNSNATLVLPENGNITLVDWIGLGYVHFGNGLVGMIIDGGYSGGYAGGSDWSFSLANVYDTLDISYTTWPGTDIPITSAADPVDLYTGNFLFSSTDMALGVEPPRGLSFERHYNSGQRFSKRSMGYGWTHSYESSIQVSSDGASAFGYRNARDAVPMIVQNFVNLELLAGDPGIREWVSASLTAGWGVDQLIENAMIVRTEGRSLKYVAMPDGTYNPPAGVTSELIKTNGLYRLIERLGNEYHFDANNNLSQIVDPDGNTLSLTYDSGTNLQSVADAYGRTLSLTYTGDEVTSLSDGTGRTVSFAYTDGDLTTYTDPEGHEWEFRYDTNHQIVAVIDPLDEVTVSNVYNEVSQVVTQHDANAEIWTIYSSGLEGIDVDPAGNRTTHYFDEDGRNLGREDALGNRIYDVYAGGLLVTNIDARGGVTVYQYDQHQNMTCRIDRAGHLWRQEFDAEYRLVKSIDPLGNETCFAYDGNHHLTNTVDALSNSTARTYYTSGVDKGLLHTVTDANGNLTTYTYNTGSYGMPYTVTRTDGGTVTNTWNERGDLLVSRDALGNPTTRTYDKRRLLISTTDALNNSVSNQYNAAGLKTKVIDQLERETITTWTPTYKVATISYPDSSVVSNRYDLRDLLVAIVDGRSHVTSNLYDAAHRRIGVIDPLTNSVTFALDENGNITARTNATGHVIHYAFDALNRVTNQWDSVGGQTRENISVFDAAGRLVAETNALDQGTQYVLDALGRRIETIRADGESESFAFDPVGNLLAFTNGAGETAMQYSYDGMNRVTNEVNALGYSRSFEYDSAGNRTKRIDADGNETEYTFDVLNRLTVIDYPGSADARFEYAPWGGLTLASNFTAVVSYGHDAMNRVTSITQSVASADSVVTYSYDFNGNRTAVEYPNGDDVAFVYDAANRLSDITGDLGAYDFAWDEAGRLTDIEYPNGVDALYGHDSAGQLTNLAYTAGATTLVERGITRDLLGRKNVESTEAGLEVVPPDTSQFHHSDEADRLNHISRMDTYEHPEAWRDLRPHYSQSGNATNIVEGYNGQSLTHTLSWDYDNRLTTYNGDLSTNLWTGTPPIPETRYFGYDARGNRVYRSVSGNPANVHVLDQAASLANVLAECKSDGTVVRVYLWAPGIGLLAHQDVGGSGTNRYYHADELGSTLAITDGSGTAVDQFCYVPHGDLIGRTGTTVTPYTFVGRYGVYGEDGPLYHMKNRYYHASLKRWLSVDPIGLAGGPNLYAYADGNPISQIDPFGLWTAGIGISGSFNVGPIGGTGGFQIVASHDSDAGWWSGWNIGLQGFAGGGGAYGTPSASLTLDGSISANSSIYDLSGGSIEVGGSGGGLGLVGGGAQSQGLDAEPVGTASFGAGTPQPGGEGHVYHISSGVVGVAPQPSK